MISTTGKHYANLDHIRALAAFMVFSWHFIIIPAKAQTPIPPLSLIAEGHTGVALFMTLSGYLFAKLLDGRNIDYQKFFWNRILRLGPLLATVILIVGIIHYFNGADLWAYTKGVLTSPLGRGGLPNGGWSIVIEFHFYLLLPLLLWLNRKHRIMLPLLLLGMIITRSMIRMKYGEVQELAYHSLLGRMDQFVFGIIAFDWRRHIAGRHAIAAITFVALAGFYYIFARVSGCNYHRFNWLGSESV